MPMRSAVPAMRKAVLALGGREPQRLGEHACHWLKPDFIRWRLLKARGDAVWLRDGASRGEFAHEGSIAKYESISTPRSARQHAYHYRDSRTSMAPGSGVHYGVGVRVVTRPTADAEDQREISTLVVLARPEQPRPGVNSLWKRMLEHGGRGTARTLAETHGPCEFNVVAEKDALAAHDRIVLQFSEISRSDSAAQQHGRSEPHSLEAVQNPERCVTRFARVSCGRSVVLLISLGCTI